MRTQSPDLGLWCKLRRLLARAPARRLARARAARREREALANSGYVCSLVRRACCAASPRKSNPLAMTATAAPAQGDRHATATRLSVDRLQCDRYICHGVGGTSSGLEGEATAIRAGAMIARNSRVSSTSSGQQGCAGGTRSKRSSLRAQQDCWTARTSHGPCKIGYFLKNPYSA